jgi:hypothetical protein
MRCEHPSKIAMYFVIVRENGAIVVIDSTPEHRGCKPMIVMGRSRLPHHAILRVWSNNLLTLSRS